jgi:hypothetical protein
MILLQIIGMLSLLALVAGIAATLVRGLVAVATTLWRQHRQRFPPELRGDWWARFEREFGAYAAGRMRSADK